MPTCMRKFAPSSFFHQHQRLPGKRQRYSHKCMKHTFFSVLTIWVFCQCQTPTPAPQMLNLYMRFDAKGQKIKAEATLRNASTGQPVEMPGGIYFQSTAMKALPVMGITYSLEYSSAFTPEPAFKWKNEKGEPVQFTFKAPSIDSFSFQSDQLSLQESGRLQWAGEALGRGETIVFIWENTADGRTVPMEVSTTIGLPLIEVPAAKLNELGPGQWSLYLVRKRPVKAEIGGYKIECRAEYYTQPVKIQLK